MFYEIPPAGNAIVVRRARRQSPAVVQQWQPFAARWFGSGTSALAAAVRAAIARRPVEAPEVLVPAYGCPDIVSAVLCAGAKPVLVDLVPDRPWLDLGQVERAIGRSTVAVVAINFLGIPERIEALRKLIDAARLTLIEDCAQTFPSQADEVSSLGGDFVVLSFGRGKPVSLLGGGAVLARTEQLATLLLPPDGKPSGGRGRFLLKAAAYNFLRRPHVYWILNALPFLGLGKTEFTALTQIEPVPAGVVDKLDANAERYRQIGRVQQDWIREALRSLPRARYIDLAEQCAEGRPRLLRYPLLIRDAAACDRVYAALSRDGLGGSRMYQRPLIDIPGIKEVVRNDAQFPNARRFAESLLTLPTHAHVRRRDVDRIAATLARELS